MPLMDVLVYYSMPVASADSTSNSKVELLRVVSKDGWIAHCVGADCSEWLNDERALNI